MLVLSKLTNINHANGGSYDPPLFLYSALFAARRRGLAGLPRTAAGFGGVSPHGGALAGLPRTAGFGGLPRTAFSAAAVHSALGRAVLFAVFRIRARHTAKASAKISPVILPYFILHRKIQEVC